MTTQRFITKLKKLGFNPHTAHELLGISRSTVFRIINGRSRVPRHVELLLAMYERHGVPSKQKS